MCVVLSIRNWKEIRRAWLWNNLYRSKGDLSWSKRAYPTNRGNWIWWNNIDLSLLLLGVGGALGPRHEESNGIFLHHKENETSKGKTSRTTDSCSLLRWNWQNRYIDCLSYVKPYAWLMEREFLWAYSYWQDLRYKYFWCCKKIERAEIIDGPTIFILRIHL